MDDATWLKRKAYKLALNLGAAYNESELSGKTCPVWLRLGYLLSYFVVFWKLKERLGLDRVRRGNSAAAPISENILKYFQSIGVPIREGFGMTETTGTTCISD
jgi:long-chain acyl-CoA synthetase